MAPQQITLVWFWVGVVLIVCEFFLPGLVVIFLGLAATSVAALRWFGLLESHPGSFTAWFFLSVAYLLLLRQLVTRFFPGEAGREVTDEDAVNLGREVEVIESVSDANMKGRIRFSGSSWPARSLNGDIPAGSRARILTRENIGYIVEKIED